MTIEKMESELKQGWEKIEKHTEKYKWELEKKKQDIERKEREFEEHRKAEEKDSLKGWRAARRRRVRQNHARKGAEAQGKNAQEQRCSRDC